MITSVTVKTKDSTTPTVAIDDKVEAGIQQLAEQHVVEHPHAEQQPALKVQQDETFEDAEAEITAEQKSIDIEPASTKHS